MDGLEWKSADPAANDEVTSGSRDSRYIHRENTPPISVQGKLLIDSRPNVDIPLTYNSDPKLIGVFSGNLRRPVIKTISVTKVETFVDYRVTATLIAKNCIPISTKIPFCDARLNISMPQQMNMTGIQLPVVSDASATTGFHPYIPNDTDSSARIGFRSEEFQNAQRKFYSDLPANLREGSAHIGHLNSLQQLIFQQEGLAEGSLHYLMRIAAQQAAYHSYLARRFHEFAAKQSHNYAANAHTLQQAALEAAHHHAQAEQAAHMSVSHIVEKYGLKNRLSQFLNRIKPNLSNLMNEVGEDEKNSFPDATAEASEHLAENLTLKPSEVIQVSYEDHKHEGNKIKPTENLGFPESGVKLTTWHSAPSELIYATPDRTPATNGAYLKPNTNHELTAYQGFIDSEHESTPSHIFTVNTSVSNLDHPTEENTHESTTNHRLSYSVYESSMENEKGSVDTFLSSNKPEDSFQESSTGYTVKESTQYFTTDRGNIDILLEPSTDHTTVGNLYESTGDINVVNSLHKFTTDQKIVESSNGSTSNLEDAGTFYETTTNHTTVDKSCRYTTDHNSHNSTTDHKYVSNVLKTTTDHELQDKLRESTTYQTTVEHSHDYTTHHEVVGSSHETTTDHETVDKLLRSTTDFETVTSSHHFTLGHEAIGSLHETTVVHKTVNKHESTTDHVTTDHSNDYTTDHDVVGGLHESTVDGNGASSLHESTTDHTIVDNSKESSIDHTTFDNLDESTTDLKDIDSSLELTTDHKDVDSSPESTTDNGIVEN